MPASGIYAKVVKATGTYVVGVMALRVVSLVMLPVYTRYLKPADYGVLELLDLLINMISTVLGLRIGQAFLFFYAEAPGREDRNAYLSTAMLGSFLVAAAASCAALLSGPLGQFVFGQRDYKHLVAFSILSLAFSIPIEVGLSCMRAHDRAGQYVAVQAIRAALGGILNSILLVKFHLGVTGMVIGGWAITLLFALVMCWYSLSGIRLSFRWGYFVNLLRYSAPLGLTTLAMVALHSGDRYFMRGAVTLADIGIYGLAYKVGLLVGMLHSAFETFWLAQMYTIVKQPGGDKIFVRVLTYFMLTLTSAVVVMGAFVRPGFRILVGPTFQAAAIYVPWIAAAYVIRAMSSYFRTSFFITGKTGTDALVSSAGALGCVLAYMLLIPRFKLWGAVIATGVGFVALSVMSFWIAQKLRPFDFEWGRLVKLVIAAGPGLLLPVLLSPASLPAQVAVGLLAVVAFAAVLVLLRFAEPGEIQALQGLLKYRRSVAA